MFFVPLILGLGAIYVLMYGSSGNTDLPPNDSLGSMEPYNEPRRPAPVAKQAEIEFAAATGVARPRQPRPIPQKDHFNDDLAKKLKAQFGQDTEIVTTSTGQLQKIRLGGKKPWIENQHIEQGCSGVSWVNYKQLLEGSQSGDANDCWSNWDRAANANVS